MLGGKMNAIYKTKNIYQAYEAFDDIRRALSLEAWATFSGRFIRHQ